MKNFAFVLVSLSLLALSSATAQQTPAQMRAIGVDTASAEIPLDDILSGGPPPNGIPAIGFTGDWQGAAGATQAPAFVTQEVAADWLEPQEPVITLTLNGESKAYPLQILTWHEIVNDTLGGVPVAVTFCPLCNSALAFDRRIPLTEDTQNTVVGLNEEAAPEPIAEDFLAAYTLQTGEDVTAGLTVTFGVSGMLYNSNLLMFDTANKHPLVTATRYGQRRHPERHAALALPRTDRQLCRVPGSFP